MNLENIDFYQIFDMFMLLLIGMGPKIALVPFIDLTKDLDGEAKRKVAQQMVRTGVGTALLLVFLGWFLMRLLHFTPGAANIAGGIVLLLLALHMLVSPGKEDHHEKASGRDLMQMALYPLAVPYLLNPAGIAALVIASSDINSVLYLVILVATGPAGGRAGLAGFQKYGQTLQAPGPLSPGGDRGNLWRAAGRAGGAAHGGWPGRAGHHRVSPWTLELKWGFMPGAAEIALE